MKKKMKDLNTKQKIEYIYDYYKWHIIIAIFAITAVFSITKSILSPPNQNLLNVIVYGRDINTDFLSEKNKETQSQYDKKEIYIDGWDIAVIPSLVQKLQIYISTGGIDVLVTDEKTAKDMIEYEVFREYFEIEGKYFYDNKKAFAGIIYTSKSKEEANEVLELLKK